MDKSYNRLLTLYLSAFAMLTEAGHYFKNDEDVFDKAILYQKKFKFLIDKCIKDNVHISYDIDRSITKKLPVNNVNQIKKLILKTEKEIENLEEELNLDKDIPFTNFRFLFKNNFKL